MIKKLFVASIIVSTLLLAGCDYTLNKTEAPSTDVTSQEDLQQQVQALKQQVEDLKAQQDAAPKDDDAKVEEDTSATDKSVEKSPEIYTGKSYITLTNPNNEATFYEGPIVFTGAVSPNTKKITVKASVGNKSCNGDEICIPYQEDVYTLSDFKLGDTKFTYRAAEKWNNLWPGFNQFVFTATFDDGKTNTALVKVYYTPGGAEMGKPVIYLYPQETMSVFVNVLPTNGISVSVPEIGRGWNVIANKTGEILNLSDNKFYPYLFWEGFAANFHTPKEGFVVAKEDVKNLFDEKLEILGLNSKEIADFEEYWLPKFTQKPYYFITFIDQADLDKYAPLTVIPKPDSVIRVFFDYRGLDTKTRVVEQKLLPVIRSGFSVVEWGGRLYR